MGGLDGAGKTTLLYRLHVGEVVTTIPTIGFNVEQVTYKNLKFQVWDLGGQTSIRLYWRCYYSNTDAVIYVVDSADRDRIGISKQELVSMLEEEELKNAILVVLANKQDIEGAMSVTEVHQALGLEALKNRTFQIFKASAIKGDGLDESMEWLSNAIKIENEIMNVFYYSVYISLPYYPMMLHSFNVLKMILQLFTTRVYCQIYLV